MLGMQIDQDPGEYRVQRPDGSWTQRVDARFCRRMAIAGGFIALGFSLAYSSSGGNLLDAVLFWALGAAAGALAGLSARWG